MKIGESIIRYFTRKILFKWCLLVFLLAVSFGLSGCKLTDEGTPTRVETKEVVNEDGTVTTVTYKYYDDPSSPEPDTGKYRMLIICVVSLAGMGVFFTTHFNRINNLKKRCTVHVSAVCTSVRKSKGDEHGLRSRYANFNATYLYNYNGQQIESRNHEYGGVQYFIKYPINVGDYADIMVNPSDPRELYDKLAESARGTQILNMVVLYGGAVVLLIIYFLT